VVVFVFDDGYESILPAADYLNRHGYPGNVAVIGRSTEVPTRGALDLMELHDLQDHHSWNVVNHTQHHVDAIEEYDSRGKYGAYEQDLLDGATWLQRARLDSAPNWLIYPHGTTNGVLAKVVARFYTFARLTSGGPESYPFGEPLRVKSLEVHSPNESVDTNAAGLTPVSEVRKAVVNAKKYHTTLILTFHRIHSMASDRPGYPLALFDEIVDSVHASGLPVKSLSQLDAAVPELISVQASVTAGPSSHGGIWAWLRGLV
jgi:peptidoglycan/xylan/chitin deacetylase (PgdA/CDA1 family)